VHKAVSVRASVDDASELLPRVHRVASLLKRWLLGTHQGAVRPAHLDYYLDEFTFRYNRADVPLAWIALLPAPPAGSADRSTAHEGHRWRFRWLRISARAGGPKRIALSRLMFRQCSHRELALDPRVRAAQPTALRHQGRGAQGGGALHRPLQHDASTLELRNALTGRFRADPRRSCRRGGEGRVNRPPGSPQRLPNGSAGTAGRPDVMLKD
jgi:hypothetical protein